MRQLQKIDVNDIQKFKVQLLEWSQKFKEVVWLDSNQCRQTYSNFDAVLAVDAFSYIKSDFRQAFEQLKAYQQTTKDWIFGYLSYDLKNNLEDLKSANFDGLGFPDLFFFQPKKIFFIRGNEVTIQYLNGSSCVRTCVSNLILPPFYITKGSTS